MNIAITYVNRRHVFGTSDDYIFDVYFKRGDESCCTTLRLMRSDQGDGGWSLHTETQMHAARENEEPADVLLSGPSERNGKEWARPNRDDLHDALKAMEA